jgi:hypothetical protein
MTSTDIDINICEIAVEGYSEGARARAYGKTRDANPYPESWREHAYWLDGWSHFDEMNGGGPRTGADDSQAPVFTAPSFQHFFVVPIVEEGGKPTFGEWIEFATSQEAARAGRMMAGDYQGLIVAAAEFVVENDENFFEPIAVFGDVPDFLLGMLHGL